MYSADIRYTRIKPIAISMERCDVYQNHYGIWSIKCIEKTIPVHAQYL
jgi:hypothetical protein